jgi:hypothetical protein
MHFWCTLTNTELIDEHLSTLSRPFFLARRAFLQALVRFIASSPSMHLRFKRALLFTVAWSLLPDTYQNRTSRCPNPAPIFCAT